MAKEITTEFKYFRGLVCIAIGLLLIAPRAKALCRVPQPRLLCAEYTQSKEVAIAKLVSVQSIESSQTNFGGHFYRFHADQYLRGQIASDFRLWEENSSGRATFDWIIGKEYLLFASYSPSDRSWVIDGCGHSGPLDRSASTLKAIRLIDTASAEAIVQGMTGTDSWTTPVPYVTIQANGNEKTLIAKTDRSGQFIIRLPAGHYQLQAIRPGWSFEPDYFSYENGADLNLSGGSCAQVQFSGKKQ